MASLLNLIGGLTPPPVILSDDYEGLEYRWKFISFRPALFQTQALLLVGVCLYVLLAFYGKRLNAQIANKWFAAHLGLLEQQFSKASKGGLISDGYTDFFNFSTGRRTVASLHTVFTLRPRHDLLQMIYQFGWTLYDLRYQPQDDLVLDFKLAPDAAVPDFVWAVVAKDELVYIKENRWDLTFTKTTENSALPSSLSVMTEFADVTDNLFKPSDKLSLVNLLNDPIVLKYFRSLSVTDQPRDRPIVPLTSSEREKHVILSLRPPPASRVWETIPLINATFAFVDSLTKMNLRPETRNKLKKTREEVDKELVKEAQKEKKEEAAEDKKAAKRKAEEDRLSRLSAAEQKKALERDRKRAMKKSQGKVMRK
ncbi:hypothetical protein SERLADRAFT_461258 [Serpula lacrymans var. lacrymans S7.9]|uniref:DUF1682-domain-containing protein n=1 Tax=Serpula lacrymans var. lacrymans (strain S7.9) TaxID=578457 RepID=F8NND6_SERL9|nr:uncharacterized protein SERLADRAFT_461258 [Serpula lacrymans var. lacrymans S7.9]EGO27566.1 hypothetical protein SERLADRAFT_461258 [Serpula lacrymans var. lacrymans S7.9]